MIPYKLIKNSTLNNVNILITNKEIGLLPVFHMDEKTCITKHNVLMDKCKDWFLSEHQSFNKNNLERWFIGILVANLIQNIDRDILKKSIINMQQRKFYYKADPKEYIKTPSAVIISYTVTNARNLSEGIDNSIIYHHSMNNRVRSCEFSIFDIENYINSKEVIDNYLPFLLYGRIFNKLFNKIFAELQDDINLSFYYSNITERFVVSDYVIVKINNSF